MELSPGVIRRGNAEKKSQKRVNTRENGQTHAPTSLWVQPAAHAHLVVLSGNYWCCSFSPIKFLRNVHNLFTYDLSQSSPAGLKIHIGFKIDKTIINIINQFLH